MEIRRLKALIEDKIQHAYLAKYIKKPIIDEEKLIILATMINNTALSNLQKERYITTTMLVQIALDTHELVPTTNDLDESEECKLTKQLSVLAGDYFSGLYYLLLSEIEDFDLIHQLASAIKKINEYKMEIYYKEDISFHNHIHIVKKIESLLIIHVAAYINDPVIHSITEEWLIMNKLIQEKEKINRNEFSPVLTHWLNDSTNSTYSVKLNNVNHLIQTNAVYIERKLEDLPVNQIAFKKHINFTLKELIFDKTSIAEEC